MKRRDFLRLVGLGVVATAAGPLLPSALETPAAVPAPLLFHAGDVITIAGRYAVNPVTRKSTGMLQQFVVTATVHADAEEIPIHPSIYGRLFDVNDAISGPR